MGNRLTEWLNSGEYVSDVDELRTSIMKQSAKSNSESTTANVFERELYYIIRKRTDIVLEIIKEQTVSGINHTFGELVKRKSGQGRLDAVVNNLIIEYKHHSKLKTKENFETAAQQVVDYLNAIYIEQKIQYNAILTDGIKVCYFSFVNGVVKHTTLATITNNDIDVIIKAILANNTKRFVPANILRDFAIDYIVPSISKSVALSLYQALKTTKTDKTTMLFEEWQNLMHLSLDDNGKGNDIQKRRNDLSLIFSDTIDNTQSEYCALYALQTTYAIIVKLIACKVIDNIEYSDHSKNYFDLSNSTSVEMQKFFEKMEDGYSYRNNNITNFLEGDFFSWYCDSLQWNDGFHAVILDVIRCIDQYSAFSMNVYYEPIDIFKDLYMSIIPKSIRHSMGEYFTPEWLADYVVDKAISDIGNQSTWKAIDPCCGSGIFVISLIKKIVGDININSMTIAQKNQLKDDILSRVYGIDINPLSVLSARVGYYLALQPFGEMKNTEIPVYLGDSAILAERIVIDDIPCFKYSVSNNKKPFDVILPERYVKLPDFGKVMCELQACVKTDESDILFAVLSEKLTDYERKSEILMSKIKELSISLTDLHQNNWDGIWVRITTNFMLIARLSEFDLIVGNPPWVKWEHLPAMYANRIKELCDIKHIFSGAGQFGGTQLNICALISNVTATNWLSKDGVLAFLMPDSIMSQNSYEGFRNFWLDFETKERLYLQHVDRWMAPLRPFRCDNKPVTQDFNTYYFARKHQDYLKGIPVTYITRSKKIADETLNASSYEFVIDNLIIKNGKAKQMSNKTTAFAYVSSEYDFDKIIGETQYLYRTGVEFTPQELYMLTGMGESETSGRYRFANKKFQLSKYLVEDMPDQGWDFETSNIYPIITGPHITAFRYDTSNEYCILPYKQTNTKVPITAEQMLAENRNVFMYLADHKAIIDKQSEKSKQMHRGDEFYALSKIGPYTFAEHIVAARDNSNFCASVITAETTPWGEKKPTICVKHTIIISQDKQGNFISEDEAHFICGILNSEIVQQYMHSSFKSNGYSLNKANIYIPKFDGNNEHHKKIVELAKLAATNDVDIKSIQHQLMKEYLAICP